MLLERDRARTFCVKIDPNQASSLVFYHLDGRMHSKRRKTHHPVKVPLGRRSVPLKLNPLNYSFARVSLVFKRSSRRKDAQLEENEFQFIVASAIQSIHGEFANQTDVLSFTSVDSLNYSAILRFKLVHYTRVVTSLLLFNEWKGQECKFEVLKTAQSPCFLSF